jgi:hypothetical protein
VNYETIHSAPLEAGNDDPLDPSEILSHAGVGGTGLP